MAKPIPDLDLRNISKKDDLKPREERSIIDEAFSNIPKNSSRDLVLGTCGGWVTGICVTKLGKTAAFGLGGGVLLFHFACELGYIKINWERIKEGITRCQELVDRAHRFVMKNTCFSMGFVGGYFIGMACA